MDRCFLLNQVRTAEWILVEIMPIKDASGLSKEPFSGADVFRLMMMMIYHITSHVISEGLRKGLSVHPRFVSHIFL